MLHKTVKESHLIDVALPNSHNLHSTAAERLHKHTDLQQAATRKIKWQLNAVNVAIRCCP